MSKVRRTKETVMNDSAHNGELVFRPLPQTVIEANVNPSVFQRYQEQSLDGCIRILCPRCKQRRPFGTKSRRISGILLVAPRYERAILKHGYRTHLKMRIRCVCFLCRFDRRRHPSLFVIA